MLDLSRIVAGPWASQILADLGADVIKVEKPDTGDDTRTWGPPFLEDHEGRSTDNSGYFMAVNRGKRSITIDMTTAAGQKLIRALAAQSDVLLENFKVGTLSRFGLDHENLRSLTPRLVYVSISGFGQNGPRNSQPAYDFMVQAMGGNGAAFRRGRDFAVWLGVVPEEHSTGGKQVLWQIPRRGNQYLRMLFVQGARSVMQRRTKQAPGLSAWLAQLTARTHRNVAIVALANKLARIAWAVLTKNEVYRPPLLDGAAVA